jgi:dipeptidyl aminopeptidase/acylaminoacyl peptidase
VTFGAFNEAGPLAWSADGGGIHFAANRSDHWMREVEDWRQTSTNLNIYRVDLADGSLRQLTQERGPHRLPRPSPDGARIAYLGFRDRNVGSQNSRLTVMGANGDEPQVLGRAFDRSIDDFAWAKGGGGFYIQYVDRGMTKIARQGLDGHLDILVSNVVGATGPAQHPYSAGAFSVADTGTVAYTGGDATHLPELYIFKDAKMRRMTNLNEELFSEIAVAPLVPLPVKSSFDGQEIGAWMLLPPDFDPGKKYPLILEIHGGPYVSYGPAYSFSYQLYAAAGFIVVFGNPRGSTSYGEAFANSIHNSFPSHDFDDLMSIVDAAINRGGVDSDSLFVTGSSGGGVLTTWIVGKTQRFRAAVTQRPVVNWTSWLLTADLGPFGARYWFDKLPWEDQETYWKLSPLSLVGNVTTPTMVVVGMKDLRTPVSEAEQYYQALQLRGVPTLLYEIPDAGHGLNRPSQTVQEQTAILDWFERYRRSDLSLR